MVLARASELQNQVVASPLPMANLRDISLQFWQTEEFLLESIIPFLKLKSLTRLRLRGLRQEQLEEQPWIPLQSTLTIKDLNLDDCNIHHEVMFPFLRCFPALECFAYEHSNDPLVGEADFEPPRLMTALHHLKPCLKEISISNERKRGNNELASYPIGSFTDFEKLTSIHVDASILVGDFQSEGDDHRIDGFKRRQSLVNAVPWSLEVLHIMRYDESFVPCIFEFISQKATCSPKLRLLNLRWNIVQYPDRPKPSGTIIHPGFTEEEADRLMAECRAAGVEITILYWPPDSKTVYLPRETSSGEMIYKEHWFEYPYDGYDKFCEE